MDLCTGKRIPPTNLNGCRLNRVFTEERCDGIKNVETEICLENCFCHRLKEELRVCTLVAASFPQEGD